jgi:SWI/SNF-related matrix-associated actin-dependent regulator 1 of chromatin subfamily A
LPADFPIQLRYKQNVDIRVPILDQHTRCLAIWGKIPTPILELFLRPPMEDVLIVPPSTFVGDLRPYQLAAFRFAHQRERGMLALDMGLGKTVIGIAYALVHLPALIVCPASMIVSWEEHVTLFAPSITCSSTRLDGSASITIVSYHRLSTIHTDGAFQCIVADECHYLKHAASLRAKVFSRLQQTIPKTLFLTGTPAQKHADIFHLLHLMDKQTFPTFYHYRTTKVPTTVFYFAERYCRPEPVWLAGTRHGFTFNTNQRAAELRAVCKHYLLRMKKEDVLTLPPLRRFSRTIGSLSDRRRAEVQKEMSRIETVRETRGALHADVALLALCREMAVEKAPSVYPELLRASVSTERTIVFFHHKAAGALYQAWLTTQQIPFVFIDGGTPMKARATIIERWKTHDGPRIGLCSLCATSTGLNLQFCTRILCAELTFHSTHHTQSEARIYRIGQTKPVEITYLLLEGSTDHLLWIALNRKIQVEATLFDRKRKRIDDIIPL